MRPDMPHYNPRNIRLRDGKVLCDLPLRFSALATLSYIAYVLIVKLVVGMRLTPLTRHPVFWSCWQSALKHRISRIFSTCSHEQMIRIAAQFVVAPMTYEQSSRNSSVCQFVSHAVRCAWPSVVTNLPVTLRGNTPHPIPALLRCGFGYTIPKSLLECSLVECSPIQCFLRKFIRFSHV